LKNRLSGFDEKNWTSCLCYSTNFPPCAEGESDFFFEGDMDAFSSVFKLKRDNKWKKVSIEAKATTSTAKQFILSSRLKVVQLFELAKLISGAAVSLQHGRAVCDCESREVIIRVS
jgi:hypothetical protein